MLYSYWQLYSSVIRRTTSKAIPQACLSTKCRFNGLSGTSTVRVTDFSSPIVGSGLISKCLISCGGVKRNFKKGGQRSHFNFWTDSRGRETQVCIYTFNPVVFFFFYHYRPEGFYLAYFVREYILWIVPCLLLLTLNRAKYISSSAILRPTQLLTPKPNGMEPKAFALTPWPRSHLSGKNLSGSGNVSSSWPMA